MSPDGRNVYVSSLSSVLAVFKRDRRTDRLTQLPGRGGCIAPPRTCVGDGREGIGGGFDVAVSPDGRNVYVATDAALLVFARDPRSGRLARLSGLAGCVADPASAIGEFVDTSGCAAARALDVPLRVAVSRDGRNVYVVAEQSHAVAVFARDPATGALAQLPGPSGCVAAFESVNGCALVKGIRAPAGLAVPDDGNNVYAVGRLSGAVAVFARDAATGALAQPPGEAGCLADPAADKSGGELACGRAVGLAGVNSVAVSPDGTSLYTAASAERGPFLGRSADALARFVRDPVSGTLSQPAPPAACVGRKPCARARAVGGATSVAVSPDGEQVYLAATSGAARTRPGSARFTLPGAAATFARSPLTGAIAQPAGPIGCIAGPPKNLRRPGDRQRCRVGRALDGISDIAISPDGEAIYAATGDALAILVQPLVRVSSRPITLGRRRLLRVGVACLARAPGEQCSGRLSLRSTRALGLAGGRRLPLGARRFAIPAGRRRAVSIRIPQRSRRLLRRTQVSRLSVKATVRARNKKGHTRTTGSGLVLRLR